MAKGNPTNAMTVRWMAVSGLLLVVGVSVGIWLGNQGLSWNNGPEDRAAQKFKEFIGIVSDDYVHPVAVDSLMEVTLNAVLGRLDPHSVYLPEDEAVQLEEELAGRYEGIGIEYRMVRDTVAVVASRGPARRAGRRPGDRRLLGGRPTVWLAH
jgi:carboxyl-terminal processing protease